MPLLTELGLILTLELQRCRPAGAVEVIRERLNDFK
jgi:hypothetical protein